MAAPAAGQGRASSIDRFAVALEIRPDRSLAVREAITFASRGSLAGIDRRIRVRELRGGAELVRRLDDVHVFDEAMRPLRAEVSYPGPYARIEASMPAPSNTTRTFTIFYRVRQGLVAGDEVDELDWNVTGAEWDVPIGVAEAFVTVPRAVPGDLVRSIAHTGPPGGGGSDYTEERGDHFVAFRTTRPLRPREGLRIVVGWPRGYVARSSSWRETRWLLGDNWPLALPVVALLLVLGLRRANGRGPARGQSVKPEYEPPPGLIPAEAGALGAERALARHVIATLMDLAVRGYLRIEQVTNAFGGTDFLFKRLKPVAGDPDLKPLETLTLARLFRDDWALNLRLLSEVKRDYDSTVPPIREELYRAMVADGFFAVSPERVRILWAKLGLGLGAAAAVLYTWAPGWLGPTPWLAPAGLAGSGLVILAFSPLMPRRTRAGMEALARVRGFEEFLLRAEKDRLARLPGDTLHRWLPWAVALGVSDRWILNFQGLKVDPPAWFTGREAFSLSLYQLDLANFSHQTEQAIPATRRFAGATRKQP